MEKLKTNMKYIIIKVICINLKKSSMFYSVCFMTKVHRFNQHCFVELVLIR